MTRRSLAFFGVLFFCAMARSAEPLRVGVVGESPFVVKGPPWCSRSRSSCFFLKESTTPSFQKPARRGVAEAFYYVVTLALTVKSAYKGFPGTLGRLVMVDYGFALAIGSPLRIPLNKALLDLEEAGSVARIFRAYFGQVYQP